MPSATIDSHGIQPVAAFGAFLGDLLSRAESVKQTTSVEPPLDKSDFEDVQSQLNQILGPTSNFSEDGADARKTQRFAIIETAVRDTFSNLIATINIESPSAVKIWNLFDILSILSDAEQCDPALLFWLVEELLDSQTIAGCRKVFDFLESRRERIVAKHFKQKQLVILRTCNELLRRLSRALDPAFCGRVFIFMFQSFPLGDKSSVNLRGEYHVENVTNFDREPSAAEESPDKMDVDIDDKRVTKVGDGKQQQQDKPLDPDALYPIFWSLQESFNQPKKLFDASHFAAFKAGLEATMATFRSIRPEQSSRSKEKLDKQVEENTAGLKRKREDEQEDELAGSFNPKYLTSRDLFKLEISDLAFRRNILVQALIIMDFLLALSPKAKEKLGTVKQPNKSVTYSEQILNDEDAKWVSDMKRAISDYLKQGSEGPYFYRMVETVLSRDKNWVRWKIEGCPSIELPPVDPEIFNEVRQSAAKLAMTRRLRAIPMGSLSLDFLEDEEETGAMELLKSKDRYELPELASYRRGIADDDFEIEMPTSNQTKAAAIEGKASKTWRALRIASRFKLAVFDKIESDDKIDAIFEENTATDGEEKPDVSNGDAVFPEDFRPIVLVSAAPRISTLAAELVTKHPAALTKVPAHVTRTPEEGESNGKDYYFIDVQKFNMMRDGDQLLAYNEDGDWSSGISRRAVDSISDGNKVPLLELDHDGAQQVKDNGFSARFIFIQPPASDALEAQLRDRGVSDEKVQKIVESAGKAVEQSSTAGFYDIKVEHDFNALESAIFGSALNGVGANAEGTAEDVLMQDAEPQAA